LRANKIKPSSHASLFPVRFDPWQAVQTWGYTVNDNNPSNSEGRDWVPKPINPTPYTKFLQPIDSAGRDWVPKPINPTPYTKFLQPIDSAGRDWVPKPINP